MDRLRFHDRIAEYFRTHPIVGILGPTPKIYLRDSGVLHALLNLPDRPALDTYARLGASWEGFALEQVIRAAEADAQECFFWATHRGAELDLLLVRGTKGRAFEFRYSSAPRSHDPCIPCWPIWTWTASRSSTPAMRATPLPTESTWWAANR